MNSQCHVVWKTVKILIGWLLKKPADLDLHCFQLSLYLVSYCFFKEFIKLFKKQYETRYKLDNFIYNGICKVQASRVLCALSVLWDK